MRMDLEMKNTSNSDCTHCTIVVSLEMSDEPKKIIAVRQTFVYHHTDGLKAPLCEK